MKTAYLTLLVLVHVVISQIAFAIPETRQLSGGFYHGQRDPVDRVVCETFQLLTVSNLITWERMNGTNRTMNISIHGRTRNLESFFKIASLTFNWHGEFADTWVPGDPWPASATIINSNWLAANEFHSGTFEPQGSQGAISTTSTDGSSPCVYTTISRSRHRVTHRNSYAPCGVGGELGVVRFGFRRGKVSDEDYFECPSMKVFVPMGVTNEVVGPFPISDYWFGINVRTCNNCNVCPDPLWRGRVAPIASSSWPLPSFVVSAPQLTRGESTTTTQLVKPITFSNNRHMDGTSEWLLVLSSPLQSFVTVEKSDDLLSWYSLPTQNIPGGFAVSAYSSTNFSTSSGLYRVGLSGASHQLVSATVAVNSGTLTNLWPCQHEYSDRVKQVALKTQDLVRYLQFERLNGLQLASP
jgi:hypothetical protein